MSLPILFLSDSPDLPSGLGRISRSLALRLAAHPHFDVGYMGLRGIGSRTFPFPVYTVQGRAWGQDSIETVCRDFFPTGRKVVFTVWDLSRLVWLPEAAAHLGLELWGYHPIDGESPGGGLLRMHQETLSKYRRIAAYTEFAARLILSGEESEAAANSVPVLSHGVEPGVFYRRTDGSRLIPDTQGAPLIGCVATNQRRKDYGWLLGAWGRIAAAEPRWRFWIHTDTIRNPEGWCLPELAQAFGLKPGVNLHFTVLATDHEMAELYSACDVLVDPAPEGWGLPQAEAAMCGTPSVGVGYAAGPEVAWRTVEPVAYRWEDCVKRPVMSEGDLARAIQELITEPPDPDALRLWALERYSWDRVWMPWQRWFEGGL